MDVKFLNTGLFLQGKSIFSSRHLFTVNVLYFLLLLTFQPNHSSQMYAQWSSNNLSTISENQHGNTNTTCRLPWHPKCRLLFWLNYLFEDVSRILLSIFLSRNLKVHNREALKCAYNRHSFIFYFFIFLR